MKRSVAAAALVLSACATAPRQAMLDLKIINGRIIDGTGAPWYRGDVGVRGDTIVSIGDLSSVTASTTIDAHDHVIFGHVGVRDVGQREPGGAGGTLSYGDGLHNGSLLRPVQVPTRPSSTLLVRPRADASRRLVCAPGHTEHGTSLSPPGSDRAGGCPPGGT